MSDPAARQVINRERKRESLTPKQNAFIKEYIRDPSNASAAAARAGYSKHSAKHIARQLLNNEVIQSILAQHFIDKEREVSELLDISLLRLRGMVEGSISYKVFNPRTGYFEDLPLHPKVQLDAMKTLLTYAKIAKDVLGLQVDRKPDLPTDNESLTEEELLARLEQEAERVRQAIARRSHRSEEEAGAGALH